MVTRRKILAGGASMIAGPVFANAPERSARPLSRPYDSRKSAEVSGQRPRSRPDTARIIANAPIAGNIGFAVMDVRTGEVVDEVDGDIQLPPASVSKAITTLSNYN